MTGGSPAINGMIARRDQAADHDGWRAIGLEGWGWSDMVGCFRRLEGHFLGDGEHHGAGGDWRVEEARVSWPILDAVREEVGGTGVPAVADFNTGDNDGAGCFHLNRKHGRRCSAARGFLNPALRHPDLRLETGLTVERVLVGRSRMTDHDGEKTFTRPACMRKGVHG